MDRNKRINNEKGVTLLALVMTIIILMIIAGVSISSLTGDHGTVQEAKNTVSDIEHANITEEVMKMTMVIPEYSSQQVKHFLDGMVSDGISSKYQISNEADDSLTVEIWNKKGDKSYSYVISDTNKYGLVVIDESETFKVEEEEIPKQNEMTNTTTNTTSDPGGSTNSSTGNAVINTATNTNTSEGGDTTSDYITFSNENGVENVRYVDAGVTYIDYYRSYHRYMIYGDIPRNVSSLSFKATVDDDKLIAYYDDSNDLIGYGDNSKTYRYSFWSKSYNRPDEYLGSIRVYTGW